MMGRKADSAPANHPLLDLVERNLGQDAVLDGRFEEQLAPALDTAMDYFRSQIATIPGPLDLGDPAADWHARLFPAEADVAVALGRSVEVHENLHKLAGEGHQQVYALLGTRYKIQPGNPDGAFGDHTVRSLAPTELGARMAICSVAVGRIVTQFKEHTDTLRRRKRLLKVEWDIRQSLKPDDIAAECQEFVDADTELTPDNLVKGLVAWLERPEQHLRIGASQVPEHEPALPMLYATDRRQWSVCMVSFEVEHALKALQTETRRHRYLFI